MKATKVEVFLSPRFIPAAQQYLLTDETLFSTVLPNGLMFVTNEAPAKVGQRLGMLDSYVHQYTTDKPTVLLSSVTVVDKS